MSKRTPDFNELAHTEWSVDELDSIIMQEDGRGTEDYLETKPPVPTQPKEKGTDTGIEPQYPDQPDPNDPHQQMSKFLEEQFEDNVDPSNPEGNDDIETGKDTNFEENNNSLDVTFKLIRELELLDLPEELDEDLNVDTLKLYKEATERKRLEQAYREIENAVAHDPFMEQMLKYAYQGREYTDIPKMRQLIQKEIDYSNLNLNQENNQERIIQEYLTTGLNPENPKDLELLDLIPDKIKKYKDEMLLEEKAKQAQNFFIDRAQKLQQQEEERAYRLQQQQEEIRRQQYLEDMEWERNFRESLNNRKEWDDTIKTNVQKEFSSIQLQDGRKIPQWEYKERVIRDNPVYFQEYLKFLNSFGIDEQGYVKQVGSEENKENKKSSDTVTQFLERINKKKGKNRNPSSRTTPPTNPKNNNKRRVAIQDNKGWW